MQVPTTCQSQKILSEESESGWKMRGMSQTPPSWTREPHIRQRISTGVPVLQTSQTHCLKHTYWHIPLQTLKIFQQKFVKPIFSFPRQITLNNSSF